MIKTNLKEKIFESGIDIGSSEIKCTIVEIDSINEYLDLLVIKVKATKVIDDNIKEVTVLRGKVICQISNKILQS